MLPPCRPLYSLAPAPCAHFSFSGCPRPPSRTPSFAPGLPPGRPLLPQASPDAGRTLLPLSSCSLYPPAPYPPALPYPPAPSIPCSSIPGPSIPLPHPLSSRSSPALRLPPDALPSPRHSAASPFSRLICGTKRACFSPFLEHLPGNFPNIRPFPAVSLHFPQSYPPAPPHFFQNPFLFSHLSKILIIFIIFSPIPIEFRYAFSTFIKNKTACMRSLQPV